MQNKAQGTIEYLVIIGVVVVLGLVVVGLLSSFGSQAQQVSATGQKIQNLTKSGISIIDSVSDVEGDSLFSLKNNSGETITLTQISNGSNVNTFNEVIPQNDTRTFSISDLDLTCPCEAGITKKSCEFTFKFQSSLSLSKEEKITLTVDCVSDSAPSNEESVIGLGDGSLANPFVISSCLELQSITKNPTANFILKNNLDCSITRNWGNGNGFVPISGFSGNFNGNGKTISGLYIYRPSESNLGLFGSSSGRIESLYLRDINFTGDSSVGGAVGSNSGFIQSVSSFGNIYANSYTGGLVGYNEGTIYYSGASVNLFSSSYAGGAIGFNNGGNIYYSFADGNISGNNDLGGLVSYNAGEIGNCYAKGNVNGGGGYQIGGLVGVSYSIFNSYATGNVTGSYSVGGLASNPFGSITNSFSTGIVSGTGIQFGGSFAGANDGSITNSFYDSTSPRLANKCGAGCDNSGAINNNPSYWYSSSNAPMNSWGGFGADKNWSICAGTKTPHLTWENKPC